MIAEVEKILKRRDANFSEYISLLSTHENTVRRNYLAYKNREADAKIYDIIKKEQPEVYAQLKKVQYMVQEAASLQASHLRSETNYEGKFLAIPPYINSTCYDKTLSKLYQATQPRYSEGILEHITTTDKFKKIGNNHRTPEQALHGGHHQ